MTQNDPGKLVSLSPADAAAVDAVLAAACGVASDQRGAADDARARKAAQLLDLINHWPAEAPADDLVQRTMAKIRAATNGSASSAAPETARAVPGGSGRASAASVVTLTSADAATLDELLDAAARGDMSGQRRLAETDRGRQMSRVLDLLGHWPAEPPPADLAERTIIRIKAAEQRKAVIGRIEPPAYKAIAFRWTELIAVAALLLIGVSLLWPWIAGSRQDAMRMACASNLHAVGSAITQYAAASQGMLPRYPVQAGSVWWDVGRPVHDGQVRSNSANLYLLRRLNYVSAAALNCPTNPDALTQLDASAFDWPNPRAISYSYQNQYAPAPINVHRAAGIVVLADKNPLFVPAPGRNGAAGNSLTFRDDIPLDTPGQRHNTPGQNALAVGGSVVWTTQPLINGDNFYSAQGVTTYTGTELPASLGDSFLVP
jgi:hypothetical protein